MKDAHDSAAGQGVSGEACPTNQESPTESSTPLVLGVLACVLVMYLGCPGNKDAGFDEGHYLNLLHHGWRSVTEGTTPAYYASKALPFLITNAIFGYSDDLELSLSATHRDMILLNLVELLLCAVLLARVLWIQGLSCIAPRAFAVLFCSDAYLNFYIHYSRLPDVFMLLVGSLFTCGVFERKRWMMWGAILMAAMTAPQLSAWLLLCIAFPATTSGEEESRSPHYQIGVHLSWAITFGVVVLGLGIWAHFVRPESTVQVAESWGNAKYFKHPLLFAASLATTAALIWFGSKPLGWYHPAVFVRTIRLSDAMIGGGLTFVIQWSIGQAALSESAGATYALRGLAIAASVNLSKPGVGIFSYVIFFGWLGALAILHWSKLARWISSLGPGTALGFCFSFLLFGIDGEVRHVIFLIPMTLIGIAHVCSPILERTPTAVIVWSGLVLSLNWLLFSVLDSNYTGERRLSAFAGCWSPLHYYAGVMIFCLALNLLMRWERHRIPSVDSSAA